MASDHADTFEQVIECMAQIAHLQAGVENAQAHNRKVKAQVLYPLYTRHLLDCAKIKLTEIGRQPRASIPPSIDLGQGDVQVVWGRVSDEDNRLDAAAHANITIDDQEEAVLAEEDPIRKESLIRIFTFTHRPLASDSRQLRGTNVSHCILPHIITPSTGRRTTHQRIGEPTTQLVH